MKHKIISAGMSYIRAAFAAVVALAMSGITDPKVLANAFFAGLLGPLLKAVDPKQTEYGVGAK